MLYIGIFIVGMVAVLAIFVPMIMKDSNDNDTGSFGGWKPSAE